MVGPSPRSGEAEAPLRSRSSPSSEVKAESDPWGRARRSPSSSVEVEPEPWGRARRSFLWRPRLDLAVVRLTLSSGTAVGVAQAALSFCQTGQWSGGVTAVTSALPGARVRIKVSGHLCVKCPCNLVSRCGDLVKVASERSQGLGRAGDVSAIKRGPRARRKSLEVGCPWPRLGSGEA